MNHVRELQKAIHDLHGLDSEYVESVQVHETFQGKTIWKGSVEVFRVDGHPKAQHAYAWSSGSEGDQIRRVVVLGVPPIKSAEKAVRTFLVREGRRSIGGDGE